MPEPRSLLRDTHPDVFLEAVRIVGSAVAPPSLGTHSNRLVIWRCRTCGHEWTATAAARARGGGCPDCAMAKRARSRAQAPPGRSLLALSPTVAAEFVQNLTRPDMGPGDLRLSSQQRCLWKCSKCGHSWKATVANRVAGRGCTDCANRRRADRMRQPTARTGTAAERATFPPTELVINLTATDRGLTGLRPGSTDRCLWRCSACLHEWEATLVNRILKGSGCPVCGQQKSAETRSTATEDGSLLALYPDIAAEFISNESASSRTPDRLNPGSNTLCRWRCKRGHEWVTTVASRVAGTGCARCGARGQSRLELEVAELLRAATGEHVEVDVPLRTELRTWRLDIALPCLDLYIDLDPAFWHSNSDRDQRKADALRGHRYVRVRDASLPALNDVTTVTVTDGSLDATEWARALRAVVSPVVEWIDLDTERVAGALADAAGLWRQTLQGRPKRSAVDVAPHLSEEFLRNETRPGVDLAWVSPSAKDQCRWRCQTCEHEWLTSIAVRALLGSGCPVCGRAKVGLAASMARPGFSLVDLYPDIAAEFISCVRPERAPSDLRPSSNIVCWWRCPECAIEYKTTPSARIRGRRCPSCAKARAGDKRSRRDSLGGNSLAERFPALAAEFVGLEGHSHRSAADIPPGANHRARWRCRACGHEWSAVVASRALGASGCPACGRLRTAAARATPALGATLADLHPQIAGQLVENLSHPDRDAAQLKAGSHDRCRWRCASGHEWETSVKNRTRGGTGCPACARSRPQPQ
ncbi:hypothetical protein E0H73_10360 [Kribbella pittospori]|uniref:Treble clef zinc finger domain-containing protein n=1 Tax=Kribbella pittospori TaxID=722689 RepID=A0A4V2MBX0_9ACTN|nr:hypothetical protein E0H73_10360 [Kribbella pittospori]